MQIENKTVYTNDIINESVKIFTKKYKMVVIIAACILLAMQCYYVFRYGVQNSVTLILILAVGIIFIVAMGIVRINSYKKSIYLRIKAISQQDEAVYNYVIDEEKIVVKSANNTNTVYHKDIKKVTETAIQYVIIYSGNFSILIAKNGFEGDGENSFRNVIHVG